MVQYGYEDFNSGGCGAGRRAGAGAEGASRDVHGAAEADEPEPTRVAQTSRLAQTGDESLTVICLVALLAVAGAGAAFVAYRKRR